MARPENWGDNMYILKSYIKYTYQFLVRNNPSNIAIQGPYVLFNTGLQTKTFEDIFAVFEKRTPQAQGDRKQAYKWLAWVNKYEILTQSPYREHFGVLPERAR